MKRWVALVIILVLFILQITLVEHIRIFNTKPDLLLIGIIIAALFCDRKWALVSGVGFGALKDVFTTLPPGIYAVLFFLWSLLVINAKKRFSLDFNGSRALLVGVIAFLQSVITALIFVYLGLPVALGIFLRTALFGSAYTAFVSLGIFKVLRIR